MNWIVLWGLALLLTGCLTDGKTKVNSCESAATTKEVNSAGTATSYDNWDRIGMRLRLYSELNVKQILLKAIAPANALVRVDFYRGASLSAPDSGTWVGGSDAVAVNATTSLQEVWFSFYSPVYLPKIPDSLEDGYFIVLDFFTTLSLDLGSSSGATLRTDFREGTTFGGNSWGNLDYSQSVSLGLSGEAACE